MANYTSGYTGAQADSVFDLFVGKGLGSITGVVSRKSDGTFEVGAAGVSTLNIAADSGTSALDMAANTKYKLTVGDKTFIFKTPDGATYSAGAGLTLDGTQFKHTNSVTAVTTAKLYPVKYDAQGHITGVGSEVTSLPASDVSAWAKASTKPSYTASEVGLGNVGNFKAVSTVANQGLTDTEKSNARTNIGAGTSSLTIGTTSSTAAAGNHTHDYSNTYAAKSHGHVVADISDFPESMPASDVSAWAKASTKPSYTASEVGAATSGHTHTTSLATDTGTSAITLASAGKYKLTAGGTSVIFTMPTIPTVNYPVTSVNSKTGAVSLTASDVGAIATTAKGANSGVAELDSAGKVPSSQLPSFVDDVLEYDSQSSFPTTGETGKIYIAKDTNKTYRWSGTAYVEISASLALGTTSSTAYYGDKGKTAYDHSQSTHARTDATAVSSSSTNGNIKINGTETTVYTHPGSGTNPHGTTASDVGLGSVGNFKAVSTVANQGLSTTEQSNARANIGAGTSSLTIGTTSSTAAAGNHTHDYSNTYAAKSHDHDLGLAATGTSSLDLSASTTYTLTAGGKTYAFKTPPNTTYSRQTPASGGTTLSLVNTGDMYTWNNKSDLQLGTTSTTAAKGDHTHSGYASSTHTHGNITNAGDITATAPTIASGDQIIINDDSASKVTNGPTFDGSTTTKALTPKGTWETFLQSHQSLDGYVPTTRKVAGHALSADVSISASDVGLGNVGNFKAVSTVASQGLTDTEKSNARANIGAGTSSLAIGTTATTAAAGNHTHDYSSTYAAKLHAHGNITDGGDITASAPTIASGDQLIINDHSASKVTNGPTFDGSTTTKALTPKGTWESFVSGAMPTSAASHTTGISISAHSTGSAITSATVSGTTLTFGTGTVVTSGSHSITDSGHTHTLS